MNVSAPFIKRPVATTLLAGALFLLGAVAYFFLPVASLPEVDFPIIGISAQRPGADPQTMAASVAAPLERRLSSISGLNELTSTNSLDSTQIIAQFDISRPIDAAARDVQAALNAALTDLPTDLPTMPTYRKASQSGMPVLVLAMTSDTLPTSAIFDAADSVMLQRVSQVPGVGEVRLAGAEQPAIRVQVDSARLAAMGSASTPSPMRSTPPTPIPRLARSAETRRKSRSPRPISFRRLRIIATSSSHRATGRWSSSAMSPRSSAA